MSERNFLTVEEKIEYGLDSKVDFFWGKSMVTIHDPETGGVVKNLSMTSEYASEIRTRRKHVGKTDKRMIERLIKEELDQTYEESTAREQLLATKCVTGTSADRKLWEDYVVKLKGVEIEAGREVLPLELDKATNAAMIQALGIIEELHTVRHNRRLEILREMRESESELGELELGPEDQDNSPF